MGLLDTINLGIVGAAGRGSSFKVAVDLIESVRVHAVCDVDVDGLDRASEHLGASEKYLDYEEMLAKSEIDAVIIATPMHFHVAQGDGRILL
jgi:predicted dehydrogenase